jgi:hypothetical protein
MDHLPFDRMRDVGADKRLQWLELGTGEEQIQHLKVDEQKV